MEKKGNSSTQVLRRQKIKLETEAENIKGVLKNASWEAKTK